MRYKAPFFPYNEKLRTLPRLGLLLRKKKKNHKKNAENVFLRLTKTINMQANLHFLSKLFAHLNNL